MTNTPQSAFSAFISKAFSNRKRSYWQGLLAGILAHILTLAVLVVAFFFLKPFVWFAFSNAPYPSAKEPLDPDSIEWLVIQGMSFITWIAAGVAIGMWSPPKSRAAVSTLVACLAVLSLFAAVPSTQSPLRLATWFLASPLAVIIGNALYRRQEACAPSVSDA